MWALKSVKNKRIDQLSEVFPFFYDKCDFQIIYARKFNSNNYAANFKKLFGICDSI